MHTAARHVPFHSDYRTRQHYNVPVYGVISTPRVINEKLELLSWSAHVSRAGWSKSSLGTCEEDARSKRAAGDLRKGRSSLMAKTSSLKIKHAIPGMWEGRGRIHIKYEDREIRLAV